jgi:Ankyrin repeats (3 copies)
LYSLLIQLVRGLVREDPRRPGRYYLPRAFRQLYKAYQPASEPKIEDLKTTFLDVLRESKRIYIIIDALDECALRKDRKDRKEVIEFLAELSCARSNTHILITSRQEEDIRNAISKLSSKRIVPIQDPQVDDDIWNYLQIRMAKDFQSEIWSPELKLKVIKHLTDKADGVFRWVECQLITLSQIERECDVEEVLRQLPKDLDETYSRMLIRINEGLYARQARTILKWLSFSSRPLKLDEVAEASIFDYNSGSSEDDLVSFDPKKRFPNLQRIRDILSGLVTVSGIDDEATGTDKGGIVSFAHFSVKEYLECDRVNPKEFRLLERDSQWFILKSCLAYIHHYDTTSSEGADSEKLPLLLYACKYWPHHAIALCCDKDQAPIRGLTELLTKLNGPTLIMSTRVALGRENRQFHVLSSVLHDWLKERDDENSLTKVQIDFENPSALSSACGMGEKGLVKLLLDCGVNVNVKEAGRTPLHYAALSGDEAVVELLLRNGEEIENKDYGRGTPLAYAIEKGSEAVSRLLLAIGAKVHYYYMPAVSEPNPAT